MPNFVSIATGNGDFTGNKTFVQFAAIKIDGPPRRRSGQTRVLGVKFTIAGKGCAGRGKELCLNGAAPTLRFSEEANKSASFRCVVDLIGDDDSGG